MTEKMQQFSEMQRLSLEGGDGHEAVELGTRANGRVGLTLRDPSGAEIRIGFDECGMPGIRLTDPDGRDRLFAGLMSDASNAINGTVRIYNTAGDVYTDLSMTPSGDVALSRVGPRSDGQEGEEASTLALSHEAVSAGKRSPDSARDGGMLWEEEWCSFGNRRLSKTGLE